MSDHKATVAWRRESPDFSYETYNRDHIWQFEGEEKVMASAAPAFLGDPGRVDPEEALVASLSSCHMLPFLAICAKRRIGVDSYVDSAVGFLEKNEDGRLAVTRVELRPEIQFSNEAPGASELERLHHLSHRECFIANSVKTEIVVLPPDS